ncbi:MAG: NUDIX domain-containing protein [Clostridium sp.]|jgi:NAD+ diphosphatase|uniref:NAD(+) diphosphatase n=1 Tax=Clostridium sp. TaxID=1506 RepID=UPI0025BC548B|nr:NUDIX domain-containing protein [Clostridium sp.]MCH3965429.1 NUDIX domain-containing protein [Clostridium sp.]MCI1717290.1 NUDIX domain-containing protein [Clostridium sp.]MCI1801630.1 NUDIX domain-containing protein [Clostridium sp.]MCI1815476.1 NUDIX domain-containing protein [Clostridium sp.]MCI1872379.1 NUDIX domain-containing protein [Clostridium sp.]
MKFKYCPICGRKLEERYSWDEGGVPYCPYDDIFYFDTPKPCIIVAVLNEDKILLLKQSYIYKNSKVLLSGYVTTGETVEETVHREVFEESGLKVKELKYLGSEYVNNKEIVMLTFMAKYNGGEIRKSSEVEGLKWANLKDAICEMSEDVIGKKIVKKVLKILGNKNDDVENNSEKEL